MSDWRAVRDRLDRLLKRTDYDEAEALWLESGQGMTRFAASRISQNTETDDSEVTLRTVRDGRIGVSRTNDLSPLGLEACLEQALAISDVCLPEPRFTGFPGPEEPKSTDSGSTAEENPVWDEQAGPAGRGELAARLIQGVERAGFHSAGSISEFHGTLSVINSHGLGRRHSLRLADVTLIAMADESPGADGASGYASFAGPLLAGCDHDELAETAAGICRLGGRLVELPRTEVDVLLEPPAVAGIMDWLAYIGFGGKQYEEGTSFMSSRFGRPIMDQLITVYDDQSESPEMGFPFDFEGVTRKRVELIRKGCAEAVVHDTMTAVGAGTESTGHASMPENGWGPQPLNLFIEAGEASREEMLTALDPGVVVSRFHYINGLLDTRRALFTGMTRDGTFLVNGGKIAGRLPNLRFTESILQAFSRVAAVGRARRAMGTWAGKGATYTVPSLLIRGFHFS